MRNTHRWVPRKRILNLDTLPGHCPVEFAFHLQQVLVHGRVRCKIWVLEDGIGDCLVCELSLPVYWVVER
jgi:hypothetical protein